MSGIFGGSKQRSEGRSENLNRDLINQTYGSQAQQGVNATGQAMDFLDGDASQFQRFKDATGFDAMAEQGARGITGAGAARGLLRSGSSARALQQFGDNQRNTWAQGFINNLMGIGQQGIAAGGLMTSAGQSSTQTSNSRSKPGIGGFLGQVGAGIAASDERLKKDITPVGKTKDGLTLYQYRYVDGSGPYVGVLAQEVEAVKPEALGPTVDGYMTVNYDKLEGVI